MGAVVDEMDDLAAHAGSASGTARAETRKPPPERITSVRFFSGNFHRLALLASTEAAVVAAAFHGALAIAYGEALASMGSLLGPVWPRTALCVTVVLACLSSMGLYQLRSRAGFTGVLARLVVGLAAACAALTLLFALAPAVLVAPRVLALTGLFAFAGLATVRFAFARLVDQDVFKRRVLVWGAGDRAATIASRLRRRTDQRGFRVLGYVPAPGDATRVPAVQQVPNQGDLMRYVLRQRVQEIVVAMDDRRNGFPEAFLRECRLRGIAVCDIVTFLERETGRVSVELAQPSWLIYSDGFRCDVVRLALKRAFDVTVAAALLVFSAPLMLLAALAIWIEDRGPIFYKQVRTGLNGQPFPILKFRSMSVNAESGGRAVWAKANDPRVTRVGAFIRKVRIDELPQVLNVLVGHMSFVGPRPERPQFVETLSRNIAFYPERHFVKPGITGWAQVRYPYGASEADAREKLGYDLYYVANHSLVFDIMVILQTVEIVLFRVGSR